MTLDTPWPHHGQIKTGWTSGTAPDGSRLQVLIPRYVFAICLRVWIRALLLSAGSRGFNPAMMPARLFWAYFTGIAFCAAGLAMLTGVLARLASRCFAIMITSWVLILHIPRVIVAFHDRHEWTTLFVAIAMMVGLGLWPQALGIPAADLFCSNPWNHWVMSGIGRICSEFNDSSTLVLVFGNLARFGLDGFHDRFESRICTQGVQFGIVF
jgi:hypothetical protein